MKALLCAAVWALATAGLSTEDTKLGTGVTLKEATPLKALIDKPADYIGKTIRVDGVATAVCEHKGCWLALASDDTKGGATVRLLVEDDVIVFPITAKGKKVSAEGIFEAIDAKDEHGKEVADAHAKRDGKASKTYQIKATGAVIK